MFNPERGYTVNYKLSQKRRRDGTKYYFRNKSDLFNKQKMYQANRYWNGEGCGMKGGNPLLREVNPKGLSLFVHNLFLGEEDDPDFFKRNPNFMRFLHYLPEDELYLLHANPGSFNMILENVKDDGTKMQYNVNLCNEMNKLIDQNTGEVKNDDEAKILFNKLYTAYVILPYF